MTPGINQAGTPQMQHHFRNAAGHKYLDGGEIFGPFGNASTSRGTERFTWTQSAAVGRCNPA